MRTLFPTACVNRDPQSTMILLLASEIRRQSSLGIPIAIHLSIEPFKNKEKGAC
jgi:hypothetical protein